MSWSLILQAVVRRFTLQKNSHIPVGTCEDFPFRISRLVWRCFLVPWRVVFFSPHLFVNVWQGQVTLWTPYGTPGSNGVGVKLRGWNGPKVEVVCLKKGWNCFKHDYILYIHWGFPPPTNSEIIRLFIFMKGPRPKPSLSTVNGPGIPPIYTYYIRFIQVDSNFFLHDIIQQDMP